MQPLPYSWKDVRDIVLEHKASLLKAHGLVVVMAAANLLLPLLFPILVDEVLLDQPGPVVAAIDRWTPAGWHGPTLYISAILVATLLLRLLAVLFGVLQIREFTRVSREVVFRIRTHLLGRIERISMAQYEVLGSGAVASRFVTDLATIDRFLSSSLGQFMISALSVAGVALVLLYLHWQLGLVIVLVNPLLIWVTTRLGRHVKELKGRENEAFEQFQDDLTETLEAIHQLRASNREARYIDRLKARARAVRDKSVEFAWRNEAASRMSFLVFLFGFDAFRALAMLLVVFSDLTVGEMLAVFSYLWFMMNPVHELLSMRYSYFAAQSALNRINDFLTAAEEPVYPARRDPFAGKRTVGVEIAGLCFSYRADQPVLDRVSLQIPPGEKVGMVGASGGGKSTLVQVLLGMYPPQSGMISFDGVPVTEIGLQVVREHVACVLQHPALLNDSVRGNLTLGRDAPDDDLWEALRKAQLADVVADMPEGLDTLVGRHGVRLSGGQRQRLAIARILLTDPAVVIFDEATSALDSDTEERLFGALGPFLAGRTTMIVAHRLQTLRQVDRVYVFESGKIAEQGSHQALVERGGLYASLYPGRS